MGKKTMLKQVVTSLAVVVLCAGSAVAGETYDWMGCVENTVAQNPDLVVAAQKVRASKADRMIAVSNLLPQVTGSATASSSDSNLTDRSDSHAYSITGSQLLFDALKTPFEVIAAHKNLTAEQFSAAVTSSDVRLTLRAAYAQLLEAQQLIGLTERILLRRSDNLSLVRLRYEGGREHKGALMTADADCVQAQYDVASAKRNLAFCQRQLLIAMGVETFTDISLSGSFAVVRDYSQKPQFEAIADTIPFLQQLIAARESSKYTARAAVSDLLPKLSATSTLRRAGNDWDTGGDRVSEGVVGLTMSVPLFEGGSRVQTVRKTHAAFLQAEARERSGRDEVILDLEQSWKNLHDALETVTVKRKYLAAGEERAEIANAQYSSGLIGFDDWIIIENNLVSARRAALSAEADALIAEANWIHALGGTLDDDIDETA